MSDATFLIYSHSDNAVLWHYLNEFVGRIPYTCMIAINDSAESVDDLSGFSHIIRYDAGKTYTEKLLFILTRVTTPYVVLIHDNDIPVVFDVSVCNTLLRACDENNIDRCMFGVVARDAPVKILLDGEHPIGMINRITTPHFITPYDVGPSLWRTESFRMALRSIPLTAYRDIEGSAIQQYCRNNLNMYSFLTHPRVKSYYVIGRPFYHCFQFLHIFCQRSLMEPHLYMDQQAMFETIIGNYPAIKERPTLRNQNHINIHLRTV
jgi:hypothetical protein